jgi:putative FmdB family regulatory protein
MPVYDYKCQEHGLFYELAEMANSSMPASCPQCGTASARVILMAPAILDMAAETRAAISRNEKARHEPSMSTADSRQEQQERKAHHRHGKGCGCHSHGEQSPLRQQVVLLADGSKTFPSQRPWMISH